MFLCFDLLRSDRRQKGAHQRVLPGRARSRALIVRKEGTLLGRVPTPPGLRYPQIGNTPTPSSMARGSEGKRIRARRDRAPMCSACSTRKDWTPWKAMEPGGPLWTNGGAPGVERVSVTPLSHSNLRYVAGRASYPRLYPHTQFDELVTRCGASVALDNENLPHESGECPCSQP